MSLRDATKKMKEYIKEEKREKDGVACEPRFPYLSFPDAYVLLDRGRAAVHDNAMARVESLREPIT